MPGGSFVVHAPKNCVNEGLLVEPLCSLLCVYCAIRITIIQMNVMPFALWGKKMITDFLKFVFDTYALMYTSRLLVPYDVVPFIAYLI